jgi:hypothetical protein
VGELGREDRLPDRNAQTYVDGTPPTCKWSFKSRPKESTAALQGATTALPTFVPDMRGNDVVLLVVSDWQLNSVPSPVMIQVRR